MDNQSKMNAKQALNNMKMEIANELGYNYNSETNKIESTAPQGTLEGAAKNVLTGEEVGGLATRKLVEMGEEILLNEYNNKN